MGGTRLVNSGVFLTVEKIATGSAAVRRHPIWDLFKKGASLSLSRILKRVDPACAKIVASGGTRKGLPQVNARLVNKLINEGSMDSLACELGILRRYCSNPHADKFGYEISLLMAAIYKTLLIVCVRMDFKEQSQDIYEWIYALYLKPASHFSKSAFPQLSLPFSRVVEAWQKRWIARQANSSISKKISEEIAPRGPF